MELKVLGSGTGDLNADRGSAGYLLTLMGKTFLIDAGPGTHRQLAKHAMELGRLNHIFITHFHVDHVNDLPAILFTMKHSAWPMGRKGSVIRGELIKIDEENRYGGHPVIDASKRYQSHLKDMTIHGPPGFKKEFKKLQKAFGKQIESDEYSVKVVEHDEDEFRIGSVKIETLPMEHGQPCIGYRFTDDKKKSLVYSGDTAPCDNIIKLAANAECLLMECSAPDETPKDGHTTTGQAAAIAKKAEVKTLLLTHIFPDNDTTDLDQKAAQFFDGIVFIARDGMKLMI